MSGNNGGYSGYGGVGNGVNNGGLDFEAQFKNMVVTPVPVAQQTNSAGQTSLVEKLKEDKSKILLIVMAVLAGAGLIGVIVAMTAFLNVISEDNMEDRVIDGPQDEEGSYKDLPFSEREDSDAPLLIYVAVKNEEIIDVNLLEEFRLASGRYIKKYGGEEIPNGVVFDKVAIDEAESKLFPYMSLKRFLIDTSEGCARFDFYDDLLVIHDYEFSGNVCTETEWNYLSSSGEAGT